MDELEKQVTELVKFSEFKGKLVLGFTVIGIFGYVVFMVSAMDRITSFVNSYFGV